MSASIKECFCSRWGDNGYILEADFSQLEVVGAAIVSGDPMMKKDILDGVDSHSQSASWLHPSYSYEEIREGYLADDPYFTKLRKNAKAPRFELQYGAGANSIARNNNIPLDAAKGFIERYYARYTVLKQFQDDLMEQVTCSVKPSQRRSSSGLPLGISKWQSATGRIYTFPEQEAPQFLKDRGIHASISPTQIANYPMQGFATGDLMPTVLGKLNRAVHKANITSHDRFLSSMCPYGILPINTIHDSILFDIHTSKLHQAATLIETVMTKAPTYMEEIYGITFDLPLGVDLEYGHNWNNMKRWEG